ncbi:Stk1 family PASTA domain-containing Ser/Thr kinase [Actinocorallia longicatena]|uniref:non-specific serine/threonine protein kinase n=1 Tax=Actinocorallia longicatena TaxID=111803 RepID=A0ABP6QBY2_9ACTN
MTQPRLLGGRYELGGVIGRGGMAEVYRARDLRLDRTVAIKTLRADLARDPTFLARFRREAQSAASLNHPSVVAVYDTGEDEMDGQPIPYIVMEYIEGHTLRELIRPEGGQERRLRPERALEITDGILRALDYSHRGGIIHRDIKPANVMLTRGHEVKVMDFGIARAMSDSAATMTATAQVIGTAQYLSPEQARGERVDARSDLYSTGCVLYELLTGRPPFQGDSPVAIAYQHVREEPIPPSQLDPEIPQWADRIVLKAMAKDPAHRYQSASEFRADIQRAMQGMQVASQSTSTMIAPPVAGTQVMGQVPGPTRVQQNVGPATYAAQGGYDDLPPVRYDDQPQYGPPGGATGTARRGDYDEPGKKAQKAGLWVLAGVVVVALFATLAYVLSSGGDNGGDKGDTFALKSYKNKDSVQVQNELDGLGLKVTEKKKNDPEVEADNVIGTDPAAGTQVKAGDSIIVFTSIGPAKKNVTIPTGLVGQKWEKVQKQLQDLKLNPIPHEVDGGNRPANTVISLKPNSGSVPEGSDVQVNIAKTPETATVPQLLGLTKEQAIPLLKEAGITKYTFIPMSPEGDTQPGTIFKANPDFNQQIAKNKTLLIYIAREETTPPPTQPTTPPVTDNPDDPGDGENPGGLPLP